MSAQPVEHHADPRDPAVILARLPERARSVFLEEYQAAAERAAHDVTAFAALRQLLHDWAGRAVAYSRPEYWQGRQEALQPSPANISLEELAARRRAG